MAGLDLASTGCAVVVAAPGEAMAAKGACVGVAHEGPAGLVPVVVAMRREVPLDCRALGRMLQRRGLQSQRRRPHRVTQRGQVLRERQRGKRVCVHRPRPTTRGHPRGDHHRSRVTTRPWVRAGGRPPEPGPLTRSPPRGRAQSNRPSRPERTATLLAAGRRPRGPHQVLVLVFGDQPVVESAVEEVGHGADPAPFSGSSRGGLPSFNSIPRPRQAAHTSSPHRGSSRLWARGGFASTPRPSAKSKA